MEDLLSAIFADTRGFMAYFTVFGVLLACGLGLPIPEDISLILGGYLAHTGAAKLSVMMVVGFMGIVIGDSTIFFLGRRLGAKVRKNESGLLLRIISPQKRAHVARLFKIHGHKIVMVARFLPGVRTVTFFTAGSAGMSYFTFICWDGLAALASAPVFVYLGYYFGGDLERLLDNIQHGEATVISIVAVIVLSYIGFKVYRARREREEEAAIAAAEAEEAAEAEGNVVPLVRSEAVAEEAKRGAQS